MHKVLYVICIMVFVALRRSLLIILLSTAAWCANGDCLKQVSHFLGDPFVVAFNSNRTHCSESGFSRTSIRNMLCFLLPCLATLFTFLSWYFVVFDVLVCLTHCCRESKRKTPAVVSLRNGERLFGEAALSTVSVLQHSHLRHQISHL